MLIDWFTVLAQLVNFVILLVVLKFLLYDRIVDAMEERRRSIAEQQQEARRREEEAGEEAERLEQERRRLDERRSEILDEARRDAEERRTELLEEARRRVDEQEEQWRESVRSRRDRLLTDLQRAAGEQALAVSRRILTDLADADLEHEMVRGLLERRIGDLEDRERDEIVAALRHDGGPWLVRTAFEVPGEQRDRVRAALHGLAGQPDREVEWERDPSLVAGIVIRAGAHDVAWTVDDYLDEVAAEFSSLLRDAVGPADDAGPGAEDGDDRDGDGADDEAGGAP